MLPRKFYMNSIFDDFFDEVRSIDMKCDVYEKDGIYHIEADAPGLDKKDIEVEYDNGYLKISASKEEEHEDKNKNYIKKERSYGRVERQFYVGNIKEEAIKAEFNNGILKISVPKQEKATKLIEIK
jgi:HSP20 family protein